MQVNLDGGRRRRVASGSGALNVADVPTSLPGQPGESGCLLQTGRDLFEAQPAVLQEPDDQPRVDASAPGRHHEALKRRKAHRGVDTSPAANCSYRSARTEMAGHDAQLCQIAIQ